MQTKQILSEDVLDILFDGKNKEYGAYQLRKTYNKRITLALAGTMLTCFLFLLGSILARTNKKAKPLVFVDIVQLTALKDEPKVEAPRPLSKPQASIEKVNVQTLRNVIPVIAPDPDVKPEDMVKTVDELADVRIGLVDNKNGSKDDGTITPPVEKSILEGKGEAIKAVSEDGDSFVSVQVEAEFPGGKEGWKRYLERNLNSSLPSDNGAPAGKYPVMVSFMVDASGNISDVVAENDPGYGTKEEAIRIIKKGPKWRPAIQNGRTVAYRVRQQITFQVNIE